jgi:Na+-transporting methylmalonyl-CoA/oxaloacetate decarboxylase gamma subunit
MMVLYLLSAGSALLIALLVILLLVLRAVGLLERIAIAIERQNRSGDDVGAAAPARGSIETPPPGANSDS